MALWRNLRRLAVYGYLTRLGDPGASLGWRAPIPPATPWRQAQLRSSLFHSEITAALPWRQTQLRAGWLTISE